MATAEKGRPTSSGSLTNDQAAAEIKMILDNTSTSGPLHVVVPDSPQSLTDIFPFLVLSGV